MLETFFLYVICHCVGDYPLQGDYLAMQKGKNWMILASHALAYTLPFALFNALQSPTHSINPALCGVLVLSHFVIDAAKARYRLWQNLFLSVRRAVTTVRLVTDPNGSLREEGMMNPYTRHNTVADVFDQVLHMIILAAVVYFL